MSEYTCIYSMYNKVSHILLYVIVQAILRMNLSKVNIFYVFYQKIMKELTNVKQMDIFFTHVHTNVNKSVAIAWVLLLL